MLMTMTMMRLRLILGRDTGGADVVREIVALTLESTNAVN